MNSFVRRIMAYVLVVLMVGTFVISNVGIVAAQSNEDDNTGYEKVISVSLNNTNSAAITENDALWTWGNDKSTPSVILENVSSVSMGGSHGAAITKSGELWMWGNNGSGQLGDGTTVSKSVPIKIMENVALVSLGNKNSAAITTNGDLYFWGSIDESGAVAITQVTPVKIMENVVSVSLGDGHSAAITTDGCLYMWGKNNYGQLGDGTTVSKSNPTRIMENVKAVSLVNYKSAVITANGDLYVFGDLGDGTGNFSSVPTKKMENVTSVSLGSWSNAAITESNDLYMWGLNLFGELGDGTLASKNTPVKIMENVEAVSMGFAHTAAITTTGALYMWGNNSNGELGDGTTTSSYLPKKLSLYNGAPGEDAVKVFVSRLYTNILNREPDADGLNKWSTLLLNKEADAFSVSYGFVFSDECRKRNLNNEEFAEIMYKTFLARNSDAEGRKYWVDAMNSGVDREKIFYGFVMSEEFSKISDNYGIIVGNEESVAGFGDIILAFHNRSIEITTYVGRCYQMALGRSYDTDGIEVWCRRILTGAWTPRNVAADGFFHSDEFLNKNTSNSEYVSILYRTFLGRELDEPGYELWVGLLDRNEWTRDQVLDGFADSEEFAAILAGFGL